LILVNIFPHRIALNYLAFQSFAYERIWWRLFQKCIVHTKLDIYVFITSDEINIERHLLKLKSESVNCRRTDNTMAKRKKIKKKDKQRSTKHTHWTNDRVTLIPLKTGGELRCSGKVNSSCSLSWCDTPELVVAIRISLIEGCC
jgi:hypothetical protein